MRRLTMRTHLATTLAAAAAALAGVGVAGQASAQCATVRGNATDGAATVITVDEEWGGAANPSPICLEEPIFIGNAGVPDSATLTILPGTIVRGQPRRGANGSIDNNPGALFVTRGSRLIADGTPNAPIVFTTAAVDNDNDGVCDDLDGDTFRDPFPGIDPSSIPNPCTGACVPQFCDDTPLAAPLAPLASDGTQNVELWGGVALAGNAPTNLGDDEGFGIGVGVAEGIQVPQTPVILATYGGVEPHDDSGVVRYVSVRHAGDEIAANNELNGVTLAGVGDGTIYEFVEVYTNWDDGHEWFGGTVNGSHLVSIYAADDQFDLDEGYTGNLQFLLAMAPFFEQDSGALYGSPAAPHIGEWDNVNNGNVNVRRDLDASSTDNTPWPFGHPTVYNLTAIGHVTDGANLAVSDAIAGDGIFATASFAGQLSNSIIVNTGAGACFDCNAGGAVAGFDCPTNALNDLVRLNASICSDTGAPAAQVVTNGNNYSAMLLGNPVDGAHLTTGIEVLAQEDPAFDPKGNAAAKLDPSILDARGAYDPRPAGPGIAIGIPPQDSGLDRSANYRGAFENGAAELWTTPWTALNIGGVLAD